MNKTKLGISVTLMSALVFLIAFFGGYTPALILVGYILIAENDVWLKKNAIKGIAIMVCFSIISLALGLLPDFMQTIFSGSSYDTFGYSIYKFFIRVDNIVGEIVYFCKIAVYAFMAIGSLMNKTIRIPLIDDLLDKHFDA